MFKYRLHKILKLVTVLLTGAVFLFGRQALAADTYFRSDATVWTTGDTVEIGVYIDVQERANALEGTLQYSQERMTLVNISNASSIVSYWITPPHEQNDTISFSGVTPGGFSGKALLLFVASFSLEKSGAATLDMSSLKLLADDGHGTALPIIAIPLRTIIAEPPGIDASHQEPAVTDSAPPQELNTPIATIPNTPTYPATNITAEAEYDQQLEPTLVDNTPPEAFAAVLTRSEIIFDDDWFIVFSTQDKQSGLDRFEIQEGDRKAVTATSPYRLQDQTLRSDITVYAYDNRGNVMTFTIAAQQSSGSSQPSLILAIAAVAFTIVIILLIIYGSVKTRFLRL